MDVRTLIKSQKRGQVNFNAVTGVFVGLLVIAMVSVLYFISLVTLSGVSSNANVTGAVNDLMSVGNTVIDFVPVIAIVAIIVVILLALSFLTRQA